MMSAKMGSTDAGCARIVCPRMTHCYSGDIIDPGMEVAS